MPGPWARYRLVLALFPGADGQDLFPVLPIAVGQGHGNRRADCFPVPNAGKDVRGIALDPHPPATPVTLLPPPKLVVEEFLVEWHAGRQPADHRYQGFAVAFPCRPEA